MASPAQHFYHIAEIANEIPVLNNFKDKITSMEWILKVM